MNFEFLVSSIPTNVFIEIFARLREHFWSLRMSLSCKLLFVGIWSVGMLWELYDVSKPL